MARISETRANRKIQKEIKERAHRVTKRICEPLIQYRDARDHYYHWRGKADDVIDNIRHAKDKDLSKLLPRFAMFKIEDLKSELGHYYELNKAARLYNRAADYLFDLCKKYSGKAWEKSHQRLCAVA